MTEPVTRGLIEYDCLGLSPCAAFDVGGHCPCARRWTGEKVPFPGVTDKPGDRPQSYSKGALPPRNPPPPTLADVMPDKLKRMVG